MFWLASLYHKLLLFISKLIIIISYGKTDSDSVKIYLSNLGENVVFSAGLALLSSPFVYIFGVYNKYVITDKLFLELLFVLFLCDISSGMLKHLKLRSFSFSELAIKFIIKLIVCLIFMVTFNAMSTIKGLEKFPEVVGYFLLLGKLMIGLFVGGSIFNNLFVITNGLFPPIGWMKRTKEFNKDLNVRKFFGESGTEK